MNVKQPTAAPGLTGTLRSIPAPAILAFAVLAMTILLAASNWMTDYVNGWDDPDSLMRLVEVRNWLGGQNWFDLHEYRLAPPDGVFMHWSRFIDLPIAFIILAVEPFFGRHAAELAALNIWPPLTFVFFLTGLAAIAHRFGGRNAVVWTFILLMLSPAVTAVFQPGRIDHHNTQAALVVWMVAGLVNAESRKNAAAFAGAMAAVSLAIGMEMLLVILVSIGGLSLAWILHGTRFRRALIQFGLSLAVFTLAVFFATVGPDRWFVAACDSISLTYVTLATIGGLGMALAAFALPSADRDGAPGATLRGGMLIALGCVLIVVTALAFPTCLGGPYAQVDPRLGPIWLDHVVEAFSIAHIAGERPWLIPVHYAAPIIGTIFCLITLKTMNRADRPAFATAAAVIVASTLVGLLQQRGLVAAQTFGAALGGVTIAHFRNLAGNSNSLSAILMRNSYLLIAPIAWYVVAVPFSDQKAETAYTDSLAAGTTCRSELGQAMEGLPKGLVVTPVNIGAYVLMRTPHSVLSAPYHRNAAGILTGDAILTSPDGRAEFDAASARYIAICRKDSELALYRERAPDGLVTRLQDGQNPMWLEPIIDTPDTRVFRRRATPSDEITGSLPPPRLRPSLGF